MTSDITEVWDPFGTVRNALWIGGGQWAGKSTVARLIAWRYGITAYHYDYHDARGHEARRVARRAVTGEKEATPDAVWVDPSPAEMALAALSGFRERFEWALDDLRGLVSGHPILAEGWGLRPDLVSQVTPDRDRMVVMVPSEEWRCHQFETLARASTVGHAVSDPKRAVRNRMDRDRLVAEDAVASARRLGIPVIEVDGTLDQVEVAALVADGFSSYLPAPRGGWARVGNPNNS